MSSFPSSMGLRILLTFFLCLSLLADEAVIATNFLVGKLMKQIYSPLDFTNEAFMLAVLTINFK